MMNIKHQCLMLMILKPSSCLCFSTSHSYSIQNFYSFGSFLIYKFIDNISYYHLGLKLTKSTYSTN